MRTVDKAAALFSAKLRKTPDSARFLRLAFASFLTFFFLFRRVFRLSVDNGEVVERDHCGTFSIIYVEAYNEVRVPLCIEFGTYCDLK